jgi:hypothetical protein
MTEAYFEGDEASRLQVLLEEVTRAKPGSPEARFVVPERTIIDRLGARFHHVLYGRRGSGKSSLLRHIETADEAGGRLTAWIDYEISMNLSYPDVLVSTLETIFSDFARGIAEQGVVLPAEPEPRRKRAHRRWRKRLEADRNAGLLHDVRSVADQLSLLKNSPDSSEIVWEAASSEVVSVADAAGVGASLKAPNAEIRTDLSSNRGSESSTSTRLQTSYRATKEQHLERALPLYRALVERMTSIYGDAFVIVDEVYRLRRQDQPSVLGYVHRVIKDTGAWLKVGTVKFGTQIYDAGPPAIGLQVPHDIKDLSLDRGLLDFKNSKRFLESILVALAAEVGADLDRLFSPGALDRMVLASGGVPRDYLDVASEAIAVARNRGISAKSGSERVIAEDVNEGAGRKVDNKFAELDEQAKNPDELRSLIVALTDHCRDNKSAWFLVDLADRSVAAQIEQLQSVRFVHTIDLNESLPDPGSGRYHVYLLDVSQLAAQRALQIDFMGWTSREKRRARKLVFRPHAQRPERAERPSAPPPPPDEGQLPFQ